MVCPQNLQQWRVHRPPPLSLPSSNYFDLLKGRAAVTKRTSLSLSALGFRSRKDPSSPSKTPRSRTLAPRRSTVGFSRSRHTGKLAGAQGFSEGSVPSGRAPIANAKKRLDDRAGVKAWVYGTLAGKIQKKQWEEALEVFEKLNVQIFYCPIEGTYMKLLLLLENLAKQFLHTNCLMQCWKKKSSLLRNCTQPCEQSTVDHIYWIKLFWSLII